jgi:hypothetical protein
VRHDHRLRVGADRHPGAQADVAMTGEITLRGEVTAIGGLKEKLLAALRGGIKTVLIPEENVKDLQDIPDNVKSGPRDRAGALDRQGAGNRARARAGALLVDDERPVAATVVRPANPPRCRGRSTGPLTKKTQPNLVSKREKPRYNLRLQQNADMRE